MAVGRPTIDPSWDDANSATPDPNAAQTPVAATPPATDQTPEEAQAIEAARSALLQQPTHEQLQPMETLDTKSQSPGSVSAVPPISKEDAATILDGASSTNAPVSAPTVQPATSAEPDPTGQAASDLTVTFAAETPPAPIDSPDSTPLMASSVSPATVQPQSEGVPTASPGAAVTQSVVAPETPPQTMPVTAPQPITSAVAPTASAPVSQPEAAYDPTVPTADTLAQSLDQPLSQPTTAPPVARIPQQQRTQPLPAAESHLPGYVKVLIGLIFIIVLGAALYLGSEAGFLSLGIERLWGISNSPKQALTMAASAVGGASTYAVEGDISVALGGAGDPAGRTVKNQFRQQIATPLSQLDTSWTVGPSVPGTLLGSRLVSGGNVRAIMQSDGKALYVRLNEGDQTLAWTQTDLTELAAFKLQPLQWQALLESMAAAPGGKLLGGKTINGVKTKGYRFQVSSGTLLGQVSPALSSLTDPVTVEAWLDSKHAQPQLITLSGTVQTSGSITGQLVFSGYGTPAAIVLPTAAQATVGTLSNWLEVNGIIGVQSATSRDATRRSDLDKIKQALEEYAAAQTPFSYPVTNGFIHLDTDTAVQSALTPYLATIPKDPQKPDRYYGYQSDGKTYQLTAVAEEATGDDVSDVGGLKLITRTNK